MIKVLHIMGSVSLSSGVASVVMSYFRHIDRSAVSFDFLVYSKAANGYDAEIKALGGKIYLIDRPNLFKSKHLTEWLAEFYTEHRSEYAFIHLHEIYQSVFWLPPARKAGFKTICHAHSTKYSDKLLSTARNYVLSKFIKYNSDYLFACGKQAGDFAYGHNAKYYLIRNAIDMEKFAYNAEVRSSVRKRLNISDGTVVLGHIGRFVPVKNHKFLIDVFKDYHDKHGDSILLLIGEGKLKNTVMEKVRKLRLQDAVVFTGTTSEAWDYYQAMDVFLLPSLFEGLVIAAIEAQTSGLPCVLSGNLKEATIVNCTNCSINKGTGVWVDAVEKASLKRGSDSHTAVSKAGYDIVSAAKDLTALYRRLL